MILTYGSTSIDIGPAQYPYKEDTELIQVKERSASGVVYTEDFNVQIGTKTYQFENLEQDKYVLLVDFFINIVNGMMEPFTITDDLNEDHVVKFTAPKLPFTKNSFQLWDGSFTVESIQ